jgi:hypothetical protein
MSRQDTTTGQGNDYFSGLQVGLQTGFALGKK